MARSVGLPTRVAVGFTPGRFDGAVYQVDSHNAHAWPEVHLGGYGWVPFEPTPGRFELTTGNFTGTAQPAAPAASSQATTTTVTSAPSAQSTPTTRPLDAGLDNRRGVTQPRPAALTWLIRLLITIAVILVLALVYVVVVLTWKRQRRVRRAHGDPRPRIAGAWAEALERLDEAKIDAPMGATPVELATTVGQQRKSLRDPMHDLASLQTVASYAPDAPDSDAADRAWMAVDHVVTALDDADSWARRWRRRLDPTVMRKPVAEVAEDDLGAAVEPELVGTRNDG